MLEKFVIIHSPFIENAEKKLEHMSKRKLIGDEPDLLVASDLQPVSQTMGVGKYYIGPIGPLATCLCRLPQLPARN